MGRGRGDSDLGEAGGLLTEATRPSEVALPLAAPLSGFSATDTEVLKHKMGKEFDSKERREFVKEKLRQLDEEVASLVQNPEKLKELLTRTARFHNYSFNNAMLIISQNPRATRCANYDDWKRHGRQVKKDPNSLRVFRPIDRNFWDSAPLVKNPTTGNMEKQYIYKDATSKKWVTILASDLEKPEVKAALAKIKNPKDKLREKKTKRMRQDAAGNATSIPATWSDWWLVPTFDISDTLPIEGFEPEPDPTAEKAFEDLVAVCEKRGIKVKVAGSDDATWIDNLHLVRGAEAFWNPEKEEIVLRDGDKGKMVGDLAHELAHQDLGHAGYKDDLDRQTKEAQAEATAFAVSAYYGIDRASFSGSYIAGWAKERPEAVREVLDDVHRAFRRIMKDTLPVDPDAPEGEKKPYYKKRKPARSRRPAAKK
jgi:hypothetical protein